MKTALFSAQEENRFQDKTERLLRPPSNRANRERLWLSEALHLQFITGTDRSFHEAADGGGGGAAWSLQRTRVKERIKRLSLPRGKL